MRKEIIIIWILLIIIIILTININNSNKKIKEYEEIIAIMQENGAEIEETEEEIDGSNGKLGKGKDSLAEDKENRQEPNIRNVVGIDQKNGLYIQNAKIETSNGVSKLYVDIINNIGTQIIDENITICLIDANREVVEEYSQEISSIQAEEVKTIEINIKNADKIDGFYVK